MLKAYPHPDNPDGTLTEPSAVWIDLSSPTDDERTVVEKRYGVSLPSRSELSEVESSSRVSEENGVLFLNIPTISPLSSIEQPSSPVGFVLARDYLITIRYADLRSFEGVARKFTRSDRRWTSIDVFSAIVDEMIDLTADLLEEVAAGLEQMGRTVFSKAGNRARARLVSNDELRELLADVGNAGARLSRIGDTLLGLQRIVPYVRGSSLPWIPHGVRGSLDTARNDLASLDEYQTHLLDKVQFLLDAVLGFVNIKQNDIFQALTVISVVGIPPTLVASIYGMNFRNMPELSWTWGYQFGLLLILASAIIPLVWFKWRKWV